MQQLLPFAVVVAAAADPNVVVATAAPPDMLFFSMGDWGGASDAEPTTASQLSNGRGMAAAATALGVTPRFVMGVGDNFYAAGIAGDVSSARFNETFEAAFAEPELQCPWRMVAGNHDHLGNVSAQLAYSAQHRGSGRWQFPDLWYTFVEPIATAPSATVQVVYIDTVVLAGMSYEDEESGAFVEGEPHPLQARESEQLRWLEKTLAASTADYLWVSGHYPIYSQCQHGPTWRLIRNVLPLMKKYGASGYIAGHDHCSGLYEAHGMAFVLAGAGRWCCYRPDHLHSALNPGPPAFRMDAHETHGAIGGFASFAVTAEATVVRMHADNGTVLHTASPVTPRKQRGAAAAAAA